MQIFKDKTKSFETLQNEFEWRIPKYFNIAHAICDKHDTRANQIALFYENDLGEKKQFTFAKVKTLSNQAANGLMSLGITKGDRIGIILSQRIETAICHIAAHKLGAISVPLSILFGPDAFLYRLQDSGVKILITTADIAAKIDTYRSQIPKLESILICDQIADDRSDFWSLLGMQSSEYKIENTLAIDPALLIYTSGTTGPPKGALIPHQALLGNLTGFELSQNFFPEANDVLWTPADWAWTGGLLDGLMPCWYYGRPILGYEGRKFDPHKALSLMQDYKITTGFFPPTSLKMLRSINNIKDRYQLHIRAIMSAGESVGEELISWGRETLGIEINEMCGQTEHNYIMGNCSAIMPVRPGSMGKDYPGHKIAIMDDKGELISNSDTGEIVVHKDDPVHFLGYWNNPEATQKKYTGNWFHTGDIGYRDNDGYLWFMGRSDDVISSAGYRIGPGEIEDSLLKHEAVLQAAVIGTPDPEGLRGDIVKAYIVLRKNYAADNELAKNIQNSVKQNLAAYEYPRVVEFIDQLPITSTGKVRRLELRRMSARQAPFSSN